MTNKVWNEMAPAFAKGLRAMPVVNKYPNLWMAITLDGFGSHLEGDALKVFADHKILIVKEEGDRSQVCQAYDNEVALSDKCNQRSLLNGIRMDIAMVDQWTLIVISNVVRTLCASCMLYDYLMCLTNFVYQITQALNKLRKQTWGDSHDSVNLRPSTRVSFEVFIERVKAVVDGGDYFYLKRSGKFDSMPACWKNLKETERREVSTLIGSFYHDSHGDRNKEPWSIQNLKKYLNLVYVKLEDLPKFRAAYFATLGDDSVFVEPSHAVEPPQESAVLLDQHDGFALKPRNLLKQYQDNPKDSKTQGMLFVHMTNHVATKHCVTALKKNERYVDLEPSPGLDIAMSDLQKSILNPSR